MTFSPIGEKVTTKVTNNHDISDNISLEMSRQIFKNQKEQETINDLSLRISCCLKT